MNLSPDNGSKSYFNLYRLDRKIEDAIDIVTPRLDLLYPHKDTTTL